MQKIKKGDEVVVISGRDKRAVDVSFPDQACDHRGRGRDTRRR